MPRESIDLKIEVELEFKGLYAIGRRWNSDNCEYYLALNPNKDSGLPPLDDHGKFNDIRMTELAKSNGWVFLPMDHPTKLGRYDTWLITLTGLDGIPNVITGVILWNKLYEIPEEVKARIY